MICGSIITNKNMKKIIYPILYTFSSLFVFVFSIFSIITLEKAIGFRTIWSTGDIDAFLIVLFWGVLIFWFSNKILILSENLQSMIFLTHFRYSFLFYISLIILIFRYFNHGVNIGGMYGAMYIIFIEIFLIGIITNLIFLSYKKL